MTMDADDPIMSTHPDSLDTSAVPCPENEEPTVGPHLTTFSGQRIHWTDPAFQKILADRAMLRNMQRAKPSWFGMPPDEEGDDNV